MVRCDLPVTSATRRPPTGAFGLVDEWRGFVFVNLDSSAPSLADDHGAFFASAAEQPFEAFTYSHRLVHEVAANWKVYCDNYGEGYHVPLVHPELNRDVVAKEYRVDVGDHFCRHSVPARDGSHDGSLWLWRYPNLALNVYRGGVNVERFVPAGCTRHVRCVRLLLSRPRRARGRTPRQCAPAAC